jgi:hypothetical protein
LKYPKTRVYSQPDAALVEKRVAAPKVTVAQKSGLKRARSPEKPVEGAKTVKKAKKTAAPETVEVGVASIFSHTYQ